MISHSLIHFHMRTKHILRMCIFIIQLKKKRTICHTYFIFYVNLSLYQYLSNILLRDQSLPLNPAAEHPHFYNKHCNEDLLISSFSKNRQGNCIFKEPVMLIKMGLGHVSNDNDPSYKGFIFIFIF